MMHEENIENVENVALELAKTEVKKEEVEINYFSRK